MKVVRLSALRTGRLYSPGNIPGTHFYQRLSRPQRHSATGRIMSLKNFNDTNGNRTPDLPVYSAVPQNYCWMEKLVKFVLCCELLITNWNNFPGVCKDMRNDEGRKDTDLMYSRVYLVCCQQLIACSVLIYDIFVNCNWVVTRWQ